MKRTDKKSRDRNRGDDSRPGEQASRNDVRPSKLDGDPVQWQVLLQLGQVLCRATVDLKLPREKG